MTQSCDESPYTKRKFENPSDNTKIPPDTSITQRLRSNLGRSGRETTSIQLVTLNRFMSTKPSHLQQKLCNQKDTHFNICK